MQSRPDEFQAGLIFLLMCGFIFVKGKPVFSIRERRNGYREFSFRGATRVRRDCEDKLRLIRQVILIFLPISKNDDSVRRQSLSGSLIQAEKEQVCSPSSKLFRSEEHTSELQ